MVHYTTDDTEALPFMFRLLTLHSNSFGILLLSSVNLMVSAKQAGEAGSCSARVSPSLSKIYVTLSPRRINMSGMRDTSMRAIRSPSWKMPFCTCSRKPSFQTVQNPLSFNTGTLAGPNEVLRITHFAALSSATHLS